MRWLSPDDEVRTVAVVGGTHGNESNGLHLARWLSDQNLAHYNFELQVVVPSNPEAVRRNSRYYMQDLNREFELTALEAGREAVAKGGDVPYEVTRAHELNALLGPKESRTPKADFIIDLHNTTSDCGAAVMMHPEDMYSREIAAFLQHYNEKHREKMEPDYPLPVHAVCWKEGADPRVLPSVSRSGFTFEVGAVAWGVVEPRSFFATKNMLLAVLGYIHTKNVYLRSRAARGSIGGLFGKVTRELPLVQSGVLPPVGYPRNKEGGLAGCVHEGLVDFTVPLHPDTPVLRGFDGYVTRFGETSSGSKLADVPAGAGGLCALFVAEAAYVESDIAFTVAQKKIATVEFLGLDCVRREAPCIIGGDEGDEG